MVAGQAGFQRLGSTLSITQGSEKAIIQWQDFSIGAGAVTKFVQPSSTSAVLNRVVGGNISTIYGTLQANGRVFLINPNGILIGPTGVINTAGFVASTLDVTNEEFLAGGDMTFRGPGNNATITNLGSISADGGDLFLIAPNIHNAGTLTARNGTVGLGAGTEVLVKASGEERLFIQPASAPGKVENTGTIAAATAELKAAGGNEYALAINNSGIVRATAVTNKGGRIFLSATGKGHVVNSGTLQARNGSAGGKIKISGAKVELTATSNVDAAAVTNTTTGDTSSTSTAATKSDTTTPATDPATTTGGEVHISGSEQALVSGNITSTSALGNGGRVVVEAPQITLGAGTLIDASGATGGGAVLVGGGARGSDPTVSNAQNVTVLPTATVKADALHSGNAGQVVFWADGATDFRGSISAQALGATGNGGSVEVSGKQNLLMGGAVNTLSVGGHAGLLLLDPSQMTITNGGPDTTANTISNTFVQSLLATTPTIVYTDGDAGGTDSGNVIVNGAVSWSSNNGLQLLAYNNLVINASVVNTGAAPILLGAGVNLGTVNTYGNRNGSISIGAGNQTTGIAVGSKSGTTSVFGYALSLTGGSTLGAYAQLGYHGAGTGSISGTLTGNLTLGGGSADNAYAQIGHGGKSLLVPAGTAVGGDITFSAAGVSVTAGAGSDSYAQIGHGGDAFTGDNITGTVSVTATTNDISLTGSNAGVSYAQIGHGGYNANGQFNGAVSATATLGSVQMDAGADGSYVQIGNGGLFSDSASGQLTGAVTVAAGTNVSVNASGGHYAYAQIGNGGLSDSTVGTTTLGGNILVTAAAGSVSVDAGSGTSAYAMIGHGGYQFVSGGTTGDIQVTAATSVQVNGGGNSPTSGGYAFAQIGHGGSFASGDLSGTITVGGAGVSLSAGKVIGNYAQIGHGGYNAQGTFEDAISVTADTGDVEIAGASAQQAYAQIGHGGSASNAGTYSGGITVQAAGSVILQGGGAYASYAQIGHGGTNADQNLSGSMTGTINVIGDHGVQVLGGVDDVNSVGAYAQIGHGGLGAGLIQAVTLGGDVTVTSSLGKITLTAGTAEEASAQIGHGGTLADVRGGSFSGVIQVTGRDGVDVQGGADVNAVAAYAQIGHGGYDASYAGSATFSDSITVTSAAGEVRLTAGDASDAYAQIGHGGSFVNSSGGSFGGAISVTGQNGVELAGGTTGATVGDYAQIGHGGRNVGAGGTIYGGDIQVTSAGGALKLTSGTSNANYVQIGHGGEGGQGILSGAVTVDVAQLDMVGGSISSAYALIGHGAVDLFTAGTIQGNVIVRVTGETSLVQGGSGLWWIGHDATSGTISDANILFQTGTLDYSTVATSTQTTLDFDFRTNLVADLAGGDVTIISTNTTAGAAGGLLLSGTGVTAAGGNSLSLLSTADVRADATFQNNGPGSVNVVAGWDGTTGLTGAVFDPSSLLAADVAATTFYGNNGGSVIVGSGAQAAAISIGSRQGATNAFAADVNVNGGSSNATAAQIGYIATGFTDPITGAINVRATGDVSLQAGAGAASYAQIGHGGTSNNAPVSGGISLVAGGDLTLAGNATAAAQVGHLTQAAGGYATGDTFIGVGQGASQTGTLTADSFSGFASGSGGQLRFYLPDIASNQIAAGASLNGDPAMDPGTTPMPNYMGVYPFGSGPYTPSSGNYAFYLRTAPPSPPVPPAPPSSSPSQPIVLPNHDGSDTITIPTEEGFFLLTRFESADDRRFLLNWYQGLFWPGIVDQPGDLDYGAGGTPPRRRRHIILEMSSTQVFGSAAGGQH